MLVEWGCFRSNNTSEAAEYFTGERLRHRKPKDLLNRLLKLHPEIPARLGSSNAIANIAVKRLLVDAIADWKRRGFLLDDTSAD